MPVKSGMKNKILMAPNASKKGTNLPCDVKVNKKKIDKLKGKIFLQLPEENKVINVPKNPEKKRGKVTASSRCHENGKKKKNENKKKSYKSSLPMSGGDSYEWDDTSVTDWNTREASLQNNCVANSKTTSPRKLGGENEDVSNEEKMLLGDDKLLNTNIKNLLKTQRKLQLNKNSKTVDDSEQKSLQVLSDIFNQKDSSPVIQKSPYNTVEETEANDNKLNNHHGLSNELKVEKEMDLHQKFSENVVFIGNLPLQKIKMKEILAHLQIEKSEVHSLRFRSVPVHPKFNKNRRSGVLAMKFSGAKATQNAYLTLKSTSCVKKALKKNGTIFRGLTLRVDFSEKGNIFSVFDRKKSIFVGNLSPEVSEEELLEFSKVAGKVNGVRIIRDKATSISKGFGFVLFDQRIDVLKALKNLDGTELKGRKLRITRALNEEEAKKQRDEGLKKLAYSKMKSAKKRRRKN